MKILNLESNISDENIDQNHRADVENNRESSLQKTAETSKLDESCAHSTKVSNTANAKAINEEKVLKKSPRKRQREDLLLDLYMYTYTAGEDGKWATAIRGLELEAKYRGWMNNKEPGKSVILNFHSLYE